MDPGAYAEPVVRTTWVQVPMVSGYVGSRLRVADFAFGTNYAGLSLADNQVHLTIEGQPATSAGTNIYFRIQQSQGATSVYARSFITPEYGLVPGGRQTIDFTINAPFIEIKCTGGAGSIRAQLDSRLKWEEMGYDRTDTAFAPQLWNKKYVGPGVVAPAPFPTT